MRISELSTRTQVPVATLKYYLREGLLPAGTATSRTQASYDAGHVDRVRLIRALLESGGLSIARVRQVLAALDGPEVGRHHLLGVAQQAITPPLPEHPDPEWTRIATQFVEQRGWCIPPDEPLLVLLGEQLRLAVAAGVESADETLLSRYADVADRLAEIDVDSVPAAPERALRQVAVGTLLTDPMILTLRRLAQQALSSERSTR
ncbi:MerR family transcriptional regulator [Flexivirga oryzae]|uniref:DNA-binding transcriptional MerR regulator n=1 Tax=Flexivirga oryzae TaxID=1794944 RepID=A0A839N206_9MICO|nr:MerR family transcriptional regulator [Flexivirga oryzae]MBB2890829.1 DNA-binding transcriptional MerR regulator [Flexivirga oryzae]